MEREGHALLLHRINMISRTVKHFGLGCVDMVVNGRRLAELQIVKDGFVNYRFATIDSAERFTDSLLLCAEIPLEQSLRSRRAALMSAKHAKKSSDDFYELPSRMNDYENQEMLQQRTHQQSEFSDCAEEVRSSRPCDFGTGLRTGEPDGTHMGATAFGSVVATHGERHRAAAIVSGHTSARRVAAK